MSTTPTIQNNPAPVDPVAATCERYEEALANTLASTLEGDETARDFWREQGNALAATPTDFQRLQGCLGRGMLNTARRFQATYPNESGTPVPERAFFAFDFDWRVNSIWPARGTRSP